MDKRLSDLRDINREVKFDADKQSRDLAEQTELEE